jgi:FkbM family methyltransferase
MKIPILHKCEAAIRIRLQEFLGRYLLRKHFLSRAFFRAMGASGALIVGDFGDHKLAFRPGENIGDNLLFKGDWQRDEIKRALSFATRSNSFPKAAVFVDVGANNGTHTVYAMRSGRFVRAVSIEPEPENFQLLRLNLLLNDLESNVAACRKAAGDIAGVATLNLSGRHNSGGHSLLKTNDAVGAIEVEVERVDDVLAGAGINPQDVGMVWIDAEGFEPQVIYGMPQIVAAGAPICLEFNVDRYGSTGAAAFIGHLGKRYRSWIMLQDENPVQMPIATLSKLHASTDILIF